MEIDNKHEDHNSLDHTDELPLRFCHRSNKQTTTAQHHTAARANAIGSRFFSLKPTNATSSLPNFQTVRQIFRVKNHLWTAEGLFQTCCSSRLSLQFQRHALPEANRTVEFSASSSLSKKGCGNERLPIKHGREEMMNIDLDEHRFGCL